MLCDWARAHSLLFWMEGHSGPDRANQPESKGCNCPGFCSAGAKNLSDRGSKVCAVRIIAIAPSDKSITTCIYPIREKSRRKKAGKDTLWTDIDMYRFSMPFPVFSCYGINCITLIVNVGDFFPAGSLVILSLVTRPMYFPFASITFPFASMDGTGCL